MISVDVHCDVFYSLNNLLFQVKWGIEEHLMYILLSVPKSCLFITHSTEAAFWTVP